MKDSTRRTIRTAFAVCTGAAAAMPLLVHTAGLPDTLPGLGTVLGVSAAVTRLLALPVVDGWIAQYVPWLRKSSDPDAAAHRAAVRE